jgi:hypothetical protein
MFNDPMMRALLEGAVFLYLICAGVVLARLISVAYYNKKHGLWITPDWRMVCLGVFMALIPVFNIALMVHAIMAFLEDGGDPHSIR